MFSTIYDRLGHSICSYLLRRPFASALKSHETCNRPLNPLICRPYSLSITFVFDKSTYDTTPFRNRTSRQMNSSLSVVSSFPCWLPASSEHVLLTNATESTFTLLSNNEANSSSGVASGQLSIQVSPRWMPVTPHPLPCLPLSRKVVQEGWLMKRGEHIKNWRRRYFMLREDGTFHGYKCQPKDDSTQPLNNFTVRDCQIVRMNKPKPYSFLIRGLQWSNIVERLFFVDSEEERTQWLYSIQLVANRLRSISEEPITILSVDLNADSSFDIPRKPSRKYSMSDFRLLKVLGKGSFGKVVLCQEKESGNFYAMKVIKKSVLLERDDLNHTLTENRVLRQSHHPFLTQLRYAFTTAHRLCLVMEYVHGGELFYHLTREDRFSEERTRFYAAEITLAIGYLHSQDVVYRDVKLENILLDKDGHIKLTDFGCCKAGVNHGTLTSTFCGTPEYVAPEILVHNHYGPAVDWWGLGVVTYEMLCGCHPFYSPDQNVLFDRILQENILFPTCVSPVARDFLSKLLIKKPNERLGGGARDASDVMAHPFFAPVDWERVIRKDVSPPWKPDVSTEFDARYIPDEFKNEQLSPTPTDSSIDLFPFGDHCFEQFSFYGSGQSLTSYRSSYTCDSI